MESPKLSLQQIQIKRQHENKSEVDLDNAKKKQDLDFRRDEHKTRTKLTSRISVISAVWLLFTIVVIVFQGFKLFDFSLSNSVMIAFLTTSLGTVLGLWGIGLGYYFAVKK